MREEEDIRQYSADELRDMVTRGDHMPTPADAPEYELDEDFWRHARVVMPSPKKMHTGIRIDEDVLVWFRAGGSGWQTRMNAVLRSYMLAHKDEQSA